MRAFWRALLHRRTWERDLEDERQSHLDHLVDDLVRRGLAPQTAKRQARLEFGAVETFREECRQAHGVRWLDEVRSRVQQAGRCEVA